MDIPEQNTENEYFCCGFRINVLLHLAHRDQISTNEEVRRKLIFNDIIPECTNGTPNIGKHNLVSI